MQKQLVAATMTALFALLGAMAVMVADFHDRSWPQRLGAQARITLDFGGAGLAHEEATALVVSVSREHRLGLVKLAPDLDDSRREVFVALDGRPLHEVAWFGDREPAPVLGPERLADSPPDGTYLVRDVSGLDAAVADLRAAGVAVARTDASVADTVRHLVLETGFTAPALAGALLVAALTVYRLASRARSRALRVLAGADPWRIQAQDAGGHLALLFGCAAAVAAASCLLVGLLRGWVYVPLFATGLLLFEAATLAVSLAVVAVASCLAWPSADLFATRRPPVAALRWPARIVQAATLTALVACAGPAWTAARDAGQTARELAAWNEFADQVRIAFAVEDRYFDVVAPYFAQMVEDAEADGEAAMSYTITAADWGGDFGPYSAVSFVNPNWIELVGASAGPDALVEADPAPATAMLERELGPQLELWRTGADAADVLGAVRLLAPAPGVQYPVAESGGRLGFRDDVLVLEAPTIGTVFDPGDIANLASSGNLVFTGADATRARLDAAGLGEASLAAIGVRGELYPLHAAEEGILQAQFAAYLARLLALAVAALAVAFVVAAAVNAIVAALLHARRDFPMRLSGATWERAARPRAGRELLAGAPLVLLVLAFRLADPAALAVTAATGAAGLTLLYFGHGIAAGAVFSHVTHRRL
ncbi:hypothetical protein [Glycomyces terrestris]|uniref:DUF1430 domain-containing protein n=1 Tax=Glycomyces terrestris TaxID=2493553 RepID=A0A426V3S9_9ACTN|nr:hypothetical protein [Glycomyces terrestris]RRS01526.1 hypothetical protein EIW28_01795 [Glycomyces terrestris]